MRAKPDGAAVFDRVAVRAHRDRAAAGFAGRGDFLVREVGERLVGRLDDVKRRFARVLDLGCHGGQLGPMLRRQAAPDLLVEADLSPAMVACAAGPARLVADEEWLPIRADSLDLVMSALSLHWVNDLPGALVQIRQALKPDGLLLAAMLGGETLFELRAAFLQAEAGQEGGARPHVSPFPDVQTLGALLQRTGFALPVIDSDRITVTYESAEALMHDLRAMGEPMRPVGGHGTSPGAAPSMRRPPATGICSATRTGEFRRPSRCSTSPAGARTTLSSSPHAAAAAPSVWGRYSVRASDRADHALDCLCAHDARAEQAGNVPGEVEQGRAEAVGGPSAVDDQSDVRAQAGSNLGGGNRARRARGVGARRRQRPLGGFDHGTRGLVAGNSQ